MKKPVNKEKSPSHRMVRTMKVTIEGNSRELADLLIAVQERLTLGETEIQTIFADNEKIAEQKIVHR